MHQLHLTTRSQWRRWLAKNHDQIKDGVWLVFHKKQTGKPTLEYDEAVEEALCFGWIDSIIKKFLEELAPTYQKQFIGWIATAKRPETRAKRVKESLALLTIREKLGMR